MVKPLDDLLAELGAHRADDVTVWRRLSAYRPRPDAATVAELADIEHRPWAARCQDRTLGLTFEEFLALESAGAHAASW